MTSQLIFTAGTTNHGGTRLDIYQETGSHPISVELHTSAHVFLRLLTADEHATLFEALRPGRRNPDGDLVRVDRKLRDYAAALGVGEGSVLARVTQICARLARAHHDREDQRAKHQERMSEIHEALRVAGLPLTGTIVERIETLAKAARNSDLLALQVDTLEDEVARLRALVVDVARMGDVSLVHEGGQNGGGKIRLPETPAEKETADEQAKARKARLSEVDEALRDAGYSVGDVLPRPRSQQADDLGHAILRGAIVGDAIGDASAIGNIMRAMSDALATAEASEAATRKQWALLGDQYNAEREERQRLERINGELRQSIKEMLANEEAAEQWAIRAENLRAAEESHRIGLEHRLAEVVAMLDAAHEIQRTQAGVSAGGPTVAVELPPGVDPARVPAHIAHKAVEDAYARAVVANGGGELDVEFLEAAGQPVRRVVVKAENPARPKVGDRVRVTEQAPGGPVVGTTGRLRSIVNDDYDGEPMPRYVLTGAGPAYDVEVMDGEPDAGITVSTETGSGATITVGDVMPAPLADALDADMHGAAAADTSTWAERTLAELRRVVPGVLAAELWADDHHATLYALVDDAAPVGAVADFAGRRYMPGQNGPLQGYGTLHSFDYREWIEGAKNKGFTRHAIANNLEKLAEDVERYVSMATDGADDDDGHGPTSYWALVELMGHQRYVGEVIVSATAGGRREVLVKDGDTNTLRAIEFGNAAVYRIVTLRGEEEADAVRANLANQLTPAIYPRLLKPDTRAAAPAGWRWMELTGDDARFLGTDSVEIVAGLGQTKTMAFVAYVSEDGRPRRLMAKGDVPAWVAEKVRDEVIRVHGEVDEDLPF